MIPIQVLPITMKEANEFVLAHHRHHTKVRGCKFCVGVMDDKNMLRGVAIVGRPISRHLDNGRTAEVTRLCTDGCANACSFLYSVCARTAKSMGYEKIITYTLENENGISLKASGWLCAGLCGGGNWNVSSRPRRDSRNTGKKLMYYKNLK